MKAESLLNKSDVSGQHSVVNTYHWIVDQEKVNQYIPAYNKDEN